MDKFSALSEPTRRHILEILAHDGKLSATEISERFQISPSAISQHLKILREADLVRMEKKAQQRIYEINKPAVGEVEGWARRMTRVWEERFEALDEVLKAEKEELERMVEMDTTKQKVNELCITRVFDAPRERVWKMWSDCDLLIKWWGAKDYTSPTCQMDFKEGGKYIFSMRAPESQGGGDFYSTGIYETIDPMRHIVFTDSFANEQGDIVPASFYGIEGDFPLTFTVNLRLEDEGHKTKMPLKHIGMPDGKMKELTGQGWNESFDKMDKALAAL